MPMRVRKKTRYDLLKEKRDRVEKNLAISITGRMSVDAIDQLKTERIMLESEMEMEMALMASGKEQKEKPDGVVLEFGTGSESHDEKRRNERRRKENDGEQSDAADGDQ